MLSIRPAQLADLPILYQICLLTGDNGGDATALYSIPELLGQFYLAPYLHFDLSTCFCLCHGSKVVGYAIGTVDSPAFADYMNVSWLPQLRQLYRERQLTRRADKALIATIFDDYDLFEWVHDFPGHLHIDLLPEAQGKGMGKKLMTTLLTQMHRQDCPAVHLGVSRQNESAVAFYQRIGFKTIDQDADTLWLGLNLNAFHSKLATRMSGD